MSSRIHTLRDALQQTLASRIVSLTEAYLDVRYAEQEASAADIAALRDQLERVHQRGDES